MAEKSLLTLREIAEELGVNHKTIHHYKKVFEEFLAIQYQGRQVKYLPINVDLFANILELKDEGYSNDFVYEKLKVWRSNDLRIYLSNYLSNDLTDGLSNSLSGYMSDYPSDSLSDGLTGPLSDVTDTSDGGGAEESKEDSSCASGLDAQYLEDRLAQVQSDLQAQLASMLEQQLKAYLGQEVGQIKDRLEDCLLQMNSEINASLTQFFKQIQELQQGLQTLEQRLRELESDLGSELPDKLQLSELDLDEVQLSSPQIDLATESESAAATGPEKEADVDQDHLADAGSTIDLDFVRDSVQYGKPDKGAVVKWIVAERKKDPSMSYGDLAKQLNDAGIPTLRGREGWSRSVVRNLAVRGTGE